MLELKHIVKDYVTGDTTVQALKGIDLTFRKSEFVSILGPSGCGKTTMLNIIGGLDRYTEGDLVINGVSTKMYKASDWDAYRNHSIGFVFQNYNLIPHLTVLGNVELAMTLSGVSPAERRRRAAKALTEVGLEQQMNKKPNQLSGGQMQRVAIARAIVNDPEIILADEPTGALDSVTSVQIADLLKEISHDRLIIMVTHNDKLAEQYSTRIIRLLDGEIVDDTAPPTEEELRAEQEAQRAAQERSAEEESQTQQQPAGGKKFKKKKTSMSFFTALSLSFRNLITKKGRTFMTSFAGSIGIIGIALVLAVSNGFSLYIDNMQSDMLAGFPLTVDAVAMDLSSMPEQNTNRGEKFPDKDSVLPYEDTFSMGRVNLITDRYLEQVESLDSSLYNAVNYTYSVQMNVLAKSSAGTVKQVITKDANQLEKGFGSLGYFGSELLQNREYLETQYDVLGGGKYPEAKEELALVVDKYNRISTDLLDKLGIGYTAGQEIDFSDLIGKEFRLVHNDDFYEKVASSPVKYSPTNDLSGAYDNENDLTLKIVGIMRVKETAPLELLSVGLVYTPALTQYVLEDSKNSEIVAAQQAAIAAGGAAINNVLTGQPFPNMDFTMSGFTFPKGMLQDLTMQIIGGLARPSAIQIYPKNFETKEQIKAHLNKYNDEQTNDANKVYVTDLSSIITSTMNNMVNIISYVLVAFAAISLVVSSIMIGIITYVSVIERTKEIGVLRSIGARKKDISRVFNAETLIIGLAAGLIGILISFILTFPINAIITAVVAANGMTVGNMAVMHPLHAVALILVSMALTLIAGFVPSRIAAKKDPVVALRSE